MKTQAYVNLKREKFVFPSWPHFQREEIEAAVHVLESGKVNYWTGQEARFFEKEFAEKIGVPHAIALANGTVALELALYALGIGPGDEVVTTSRTFIATASSAVMRGAVPIFSDVDHESQNITADSVKAVLTPRTRAIIAVHLAGWPCDMDPLMELAREHGLKVIEDCAQSHGATYKGRQVGSFGDAAAFSFCQDKILTTGGEGGMLVLNDSEAWSRAWSYKDHGKSFEAVYERVHPSGYRWLHDSFGTNWRITEMQAAIGRVMLRRLDGWLEARRRNADVLTRLLADVQGMRLTVPPPEIGHSYYKYYVFLDTQLLRPDWSRERIVEAVESRGVPCFSGSCSEIYLEHAFEAAGLRPPGRLPVARTLGETSLMFLVHPTLGEEHMAETARVIKEVMGEAVSPSAARKPPITEARFA